MLLVDRFVGLKGPKFFTKYSQFIRGRFGNVVGVQRRSDRLDSEKHAQPGMSYSHHLLDRRFSRVIGKVRSH
jgi:hypothetical protein